MNKRHYEWFHLKADWKLQCLMSLPYKKRAPAFKENRGHSDQWWPFCPWLFQSLRKLQDCLTKLANFRFVLQKFSACLQPLFNRQILIIDIFSFFLNFICFCLHNLKKVLKQYHLNTKIIFSNPKLLSVETKICVSSRFSLCPGENFCLTLPLVALQKFPRRLLFQIIKP